MVGAFPCDARVSVPMKERSTSLRTPQPLEPDNPVPKLLDKIGDPNMYIRVLALFALVLVLMAGPSFAASCATDGNSCSNLVTPTDTTAIFDFSSGGKGYLVVQFDTVLTTFTLTVTTSGFTDTLDPTEFPAGTVCVQYE